jgi:hypothetical protein
VSQRLTETQSLKSGRRSPRDALQRLKKMDPRIKIKEIRSCSDVILRILMVKVFHSCNMEARLKSSRIAILPKAVGGTRNRGQ